MPQLDIEQIKRILPHRYPFLLIDRVLEYWPGEWARAIKCVSANEQFFEGHFPGQAVMPGVLILEALAQTGAIALLSEPGNEGHIALFGGVKNARFKRPVKPGDVLELECKLKRRWGLVGNGDAVATVRGEVVCKAEISFVLPDMAGGITKGDATDSASNNAEGETRSNMTNDAAGAATDDTTNDATNDADKAGT